MNGIQLHPQTPTEIKISDKIILGECKNYLVIEGIKFILTESDIGKEKRPHSRKHRRYDSRSTSMKKGNSSSPSSHSSYYYHKDYSPDDAKSKYSRKYKEKNYQ